MEDIGRMEVFETTEHLVQEVLEVLVCEGLVGRDDTVQIRLLISTERED